MRKGAIYLEKYDEIVLLYMSKLSYKEIGITLGIGHTVICKAIKLAKDRGDVVGRSQTSTHARLRMALADTFAQEETDEERFLPWTSAMVERAILERANADFVKCLREHHPERETGLKKREEVADSSMWNNGLKPRLRDESICGSPAASCVDE